MRDGMIAGLRRLRRHCSASPDARVIDHRPHLLMAGFIDAHIHFPQVQVVASWGSQLLDWLNGYTFPAEAQYADAQHARAMARHFCDLLTDHGTTTAVAFCSVHKASAEALFAEAERSRHAHDRRQDDDGPERARLPCSTRRSRAMTTARN